MALSLESRAAMAVDSIYSTARISGLPSSWINDEYIKRLAELPKRTPYYVRAYADGYRRALENQLYAEYLVFGGIVNGEFYSCDCQRDDYYSKQGIDAAEWHRLAKLKGHYWKHNLRPFFTDMESES